MIVRIHSRLEQSNNIPCEQSNLEGLSDLHQSSDFCRHDESLHTCDFLFSKDSCVANRTGPVTVHSAFLPACKEKGLE